MKTRFFILFLFLVYSLSTPAIAQITLSEIMNDPSGSESYDEFIEIFNTSFTDSVNLAGWQVSDGAGTDLLISPESSSMKLAPRAYALILDAGYFENSTWYDHLIPAEALILTIDNGTFGSSGLSNSTAETVSIFDTSGVAQSQYTYPIGNPPGYSMEKVDMDAGDDAANWQITKNENGTPGFSNSVLPVQHDLSVIENDFNYSPAQPISGETVRLTLWIHNIGRQAAGDFTVYFYIDENANQQPDAGETLFLPLTVTNPVQPNDSLLVQGNWENVSSGVHTIQVFVQWERDENPDDNQFSIEISVGIETLSVIINEIMYRPSAGEAEWVELQNIGLENINLKDWTFSDERVTSAVLITSNDFILEPQQYVIIAEDETILNNYPEVENHLLIPPAGFPALNDDDDGVVIKDFTGRVSDSLHYKSSWGGETGVSLERISSTQPGIDPENWAACRAAGGATPLQKNSVLPLQHDLSAADGDLSYSPIQPISGETVTLTLWIHNTGQQAANDFSVYFYIDDNANQQPDEGETLFSPLLVTNPVQPNDSLLVQGRWENVPSGVHTIQVFVQWESDENPDDNQFSTKISVGIETLRVIINEIMYRPSAGEPEWVELQNIGEENLNLKDWTFSDERVTSAVAITTNDFILEPQQYVIIAEDETILNYYPEVENHLLIPPAGFPALNNDDDGVVIKDFSGRIADSLHYKSSWGGETGISLERILPTQPGIDTENWATCQAETGATPNAKNSVYPPEYDLAIENETLNAKPEQVRAQGEVVISGSVQNKGLLAISAFQVILFEDLNQDSLYSANEMLQNFMPNSEIEPGAEIVFQFSQIIENPGSHPMGVYLDAETDENSKNNLSFVEILTGFPAKSLVINEILYQPQSGNPEWIEIFNPHAESVDLFQWTLQDADVRNKIVLTNEHLEIEPNSFAIITRDAAFSEIYPDVTCPVMVHSQFPTLNNTSDEVVLKDLAGFTCDSVFYQSDWGSETGYSLERVHWLRDSNAATSWQLSQAEAGGTPGAQNSNFPFAYDLALNPDSTFLMPEIISLGDSIKISVQIENHGQNPASGGILQIYFNSVGDSGLAEPVVETEIFQSFEGGAQQTFEFTFSVNQSGHRWIIPVIQYEADEFPEDNFLILEIKVGDSPGSIVINEIMYDPFSEQPEWIEIFNRGDQSVDIGEWAIADGTGEKAISFGFEPQFLKPGDFAVVTGDSSFFTNWAEVKSKVLLTQQSFPSLNNSEENVFLFDMAGNLMDSVAYNSDWGGDLGISLERINPRLPSMESTNWSSCVEPKGGTPGAANSIYISSLPQSAELSISPNPFSPDQDGIDDFAIISYQLPLLTSQVNLKIFDVKGRLIRDVLNNAPSGAERSVLWDGRDNQNQFARIGIYVVYLEALNARAGVLTKLTKTVVLANKL